MNKHYQSPLAFTRSTHTVVLGLLVLFLIGGGAYLYANSRNTPTAVVIYNSGIRHELLYSDGQATSARRVVEQLLAETHDGLYEPVDAHSLVSSSGMAIEVRYNTSVTLHIGYPKPGTAVRVDRLLLKLNGDHARLLLLGNGSYDNTPFYIPSADQAVLDRLRQDLTSRGY